MKAVRVHRWGGPEVLAVDELPAPHAGPGQVRVRVAAASLNPVDIRSVSDPGRAEVFGMTLPTGVANDIAGVVDEVGEGVTDFLEGDRVFGGARLRGGDEYAVVTPPTEPIPRSLHGDELYHIPEVLEDEVAATIQTAGLTADAAVTAVSPGPDDTVLVGGAAGGVGVYAVQLARRSGARVLGTASASTAGFLRALGAEPVNHKNSLIDQVTELAPEGITVAVDLHGTDVALAALKLGVPGKRVSAVAARGHRAAEQITLTGSLRAPADSSNRLAALLASGDLQVPLAAVHPIEEIRDAAETLATGHAHGKVVVTF